MKKKRRFFMDEILQTLEVVFVLAMKKTTLALMMWGTPKKTPAERKQQEKNKLWLLRFQATITAAPSKAPFLYNCGPQKKRPR